MSKPTYKRAERVGDQIRMEVAEILARKSKDPRLNLVTVTDVDMSSDLRMARIYVSTMYQGQEAEDVLKSLTRAVGFIRTEIGRRMTLRYVPDLKFHMDPSGLRGDRICQVLDQLDIPAEVTIGESGDQMVPSE
ncbi:MAG: 30S ribosome-binding factor RbfA [Nitrospirae bacterium]|nr:30S ribosome-binding factor RbfA [Nitrospirota bacterium]